MKKINKNQLRKKIDSLNREYFNGKLNFRVYHQLLAEYMPQLHEILRNEDLLTKQLKNQYCLVLKNISYIDKNFETLDKDEADRYFRLLKLEKELSLKISKIECDKGIKYNGK